MIPRIEKQWLAGDVLRNKEINRMVEHFESEIDENFLSKMNRKRSVLEAKTKIGLYFSLAYFSG